MPPGFPAMLLETWLTIAILVIAYVGKNSVTPVVTTTRFPRPVATGSSVVFETNRLAIELQHPPPVLVAGPAGEPAGVAAPVL
jgi:acyl dehydratase